jgi:DNA-binding NarL/FixJ family response regulator
MTTVTNDHSHFGKRKVMIVDDHPLVRRGVAELIAHEADLELCGEAADVAGAMHLVKTTHPHVVIVDLSLQSGHGIELIEQIRALDGNIKMLVLSVHDESLFAERVLRAGAVGYVNKQEPAQQLLEAIREVLAGRIHLSAAMAGRLLYSVVAGQALEHDPIQTLSNRELQIFELIGQGQSTKEIAGRLHLSPKTVESHREKIKSKLSVGKSAELNRRAVQWVLEKR